MNVKILLGLLVLVIAGIVSWSFYQLVNEGLGNFLGMFGVNSSLMQNSIIVVIGVILLIFVGGYGLAKLTKIL